MCEPRKLEFGMWFNGRSHSLWCYDSVPDGMRRARANDMHPGRQFLYQVQLGPDAGLYYTGYFAGESMLPILLYIRTGVPVYVKD